MRNLGLLLLRLTAGAVLVAHGYPKLFGGPGKKPHPLIAGAMGTNYPAAFERSGPGFAAGLEKRGVPYPKLAATASGLAEFGGGIALATGFLTRPVALAVAFNMGVAVSTHSKVGFYGQGGYEFALLLGSTALGLGLIGPGDISIDRLIGPKS
jgi:putative oxidoreductase